MREERKVTGNFHSLDRCQKLCICRHCVCIQSTSRRNCQKSKLVQVALVRCESNGFQQAAVGQINLREEQQSQRQRLQYKKRFTFENWPLVEEKKYPYLPLGDTKQAEVV